MANQALDRVKTWDKLAGNTPWRILRFPLEKDPRWSAFNPSVAFSEELGYWVLFRSSNYFLDPKTTSAVITTNENRVKTRLWLGKLSDSLDSIVLDSLIELDYSSAGIEFKRGPEDGRLYWTKDGWEFTAGLHEPSIPLPRIGRFKVEKSTVKLLKIYDSGPLYDVEKNWMGTSDGSGDFSYIYNPVSVYIDEHGPLQVRDVSSELVDVRGGTQLVPIGGGSYLAVIHEAIVRDVYMYLPRYFSYKTVKIRNYVHKFAKYSSSGKLIGLSEPFSFTGARIEFAAGLVIKDEEVYISYGHQDVASYMAKIKLKKVMELIKNI
jgi:hypothetical protein